MNSKKADYSKNKYGERGKKVAFYIAGLAPEQPIVGRDQFEEMLLQLKEIMELAGFNRGQMTIGPAFEVFGQNRNKERALFLKSRQEFEAQIKAERDSGGISCDCGDHEEVHSKKRIDPSTNTHGAQGLRPAFFLGMVADERSILSDTVLQKRLNTIGQVFAAGGFRVINIRSGPAFGVFGEEAMEGLKVMLDPAKIEEKAEHLHIGHSAEDCPAKQCAQEENLAENPMPRFED